MPTNFVSESVEVIDLGKFMLYLLKGRKGAFDWGRGSQEVEFIKDILEVLENGLGKEKDNLAELSLKGFDGWKIISFWYEPLLEVFRDLAFVVKGKLLLEAEVDDDHFVRSEIVWADQKCIIRMSEKIKGNSDKWYEFTPEELAEEFEYNLRPLPDF